MSLKILVFHLEKNRRPIRRNSPVNFETYKKTIVGSVDNLKFGNPDILLMKYDFYIEKFGDIISKKGAFYSADFGYFPNIRNIKYYIDRGWNKSEAAIKVKELQSQTSIKSFIKRYGQNGLKKYDEYIAKKSNTYSENYKSGKHKKFYRPTEIKYWINKGYTSKEAKKEMSEKFRKVSLKFHERLLKNGIKWLTCRQIEFWIKKGLSIVEAHEQIRRICDTRSLISRIEKYGIKTGTEKFHESNKKWLKTLDNKSEKEKLRINLSKFKSGTRYSKKSIHFFEILLNELNYQGKYQWKNNEYFIYDSSSKKIFFYDLYLQDLNLLIEYNGILFHPNKDQLNEIQWNSWINPYNGESAEDKWKKDQYKLNIAIKNKFNIIEVWENKTLTENISKIKDYINKIKI